MAYPSTSPYYNTPTTVESLDLLNKRVFRFEEDDVVYEIDILSFTGPATHNNLSIINLEKISI